MTVRDLMNEITMDCCVAYIYPNPGSDQLIIEVQMDSSIRSQDKRAGEVALMSCRQRNPERGLRISKI